MSTINGGPAILRSVLFGLLAARWLDFTNRLFVKKLCFSMAVAAAKIFFISELNSFLAGHPVHEYQNQPYALNGESRQALRTNASYTFLRRCKTGVCRP